MANRSIFFSDGTSGTLTGTYTIATGDSTVTGCAIAEDSDSDTERVLFADLADDNSSTPTIKVEIAMYFDSGWSDWQEIDAAVAVPREVKVVSYDSSWWVKNKGVKFKFTKSGAGAVTITNAKWL